MQVAFWEILIHRCNFTAAIDFGSKIPTGLTFEWCD
jgi:hypothetical protein